MSMTLKERINRGLSIAETHEHFKPLRPKDTGEFKDFRTKAEVPIDKKPTTP